MTPQPSRAGCGRDVDDTLIGIGRRHARRTATVLRTGDHVTARIDDDLIRELTIDRAQHYRPQNTSCHRCPETYVSPMS